MRKRQKHNLSYYRLLSGDGGELLPVGLTEVLPGDSVQMASSVFIRVAPLATPVMHPVIARIHHWFVPLRLLWDDWEDHITGGAEGIDTSEHPTIDLGTVQVGSLADYLGVPTGPVPPVSALPFRAYALVWNEWYRDQDLQAEVPISFDSGQDTTTSTQLKHVAWGKDYFTAARPDTQKGPEVLIPLGDKAPVKGHMVLSDGTNMSKIAQNSGASRPLYTQSPLAAGAPLQSAENSAGEGLYADLAAMTGISVTDLREALAIQRYQEARMRFGSRYSEYLRYLGVISSDARLQRPEYLGGGKQTISFSEVLQTAEGNNPVGTLRGHGIGGMRSRTFRRFFEEHGFIFSLLSIRPQSIYMQGLNRLWLRRTKEDYWQPELAHIGDQPVYNAEVYAQHSEPMGVFGYSPRHQEYRQSWSGVSGEFRTILKDWHMAREFAGQPALNGDFVRCVPTDRVFQSQDTDTYYIMTRHKIVARRLVTKSTASFIY